MNEFENQLTKMLKKALELSEVTGDFAVEQAPQILQEFYLWHTYSLILKVLLLPLLLLLVFKIFKLCGSVEQTNFCDTKFFNRFYNTEDTGFVF